MDYKFSLIGKRIPRIDSIKKAIGKALYTGDIKLPGMLYGRILRSPFPHARIRRIETQKAKRLLGVKSIITSVDTPKIKFGLSIEDELPLTDKKVRFIGDEVAAVAAFDEDTAEEALDLIQVEYEEISAVFNMEEALQPNAPKLHESADRNIAFRTFITRGDIEVGFRETDYISEEEFYTPLVHTAPIEPLCCVAQFDTDGRLTLWAPLQEVGRSIFPLAKALSLPLEKIRIIQPTIGGGFGGKNGIQPFHVISALLAKKAGSPVRLVNNRQEEMEVNRPAVPMKIWSRIGVKRDGRIIAKETKILADNGAYSGHGPPITIAAAVRFDSVYRQKNLKTEATLVYTNNIPTGAYRGYGATQIAFALESHLDIIAREIGIDPLDLRLRNATQTGDISVHGWNITSSGLVDCLKSVAKASKWGHRRKAKEDHGIGIACSIHICGLKSPTKIRGSTATVEIKKDGRVLIISGEGEIGQGANTVFSQIVAEELCLPLESIELSSLDTDKTPLSLGAFSSRVTVIGGNAVLIAASDAKKQLLDVAASLLGEKPGNLRLRKGMIQFGKHYRRSVSIGDVAGEAASRGAPIVGKGTYDTGLDLPDKNTLYGDIASSYSFAAHIAEVEVNRKTGVVNVLRLFCAHDIGMAINPMACEGQIEGGVAQGIGYALFEELKREKGKILNPSFTDYKIMRALDVPDIKCILVETNDPVGPYGAKGLGEEVTVPVAPAISNAIFDAIGVRVRQLPITPEKILYELTRK